MKNSKITTALVFIIMSFSYGYSNNNDFYNNEFILCNNCLKEIKQECSKGITDSEVLEFSSLYKYNATDFTTCDLDLIDSKYNLEDKINNKIDEIRYHENHLHPLCILNNANFDIINFSIKDKFVDILNHGHCCNFG